MPDLIRQSVWCGTFRARPPSSRCRAGVRRSNRSTGSICPALPVASHPAPFLLSASRTIEMAHPKRFELLTPRFVVWCSIQLSYGCVLRAGTYWGGSPKARTTRASPGHCRRTPQNPCKSQWKRADFRPKRHPGPLSPPALLVKTGRQTARAIVAGGWGAKLDFSAARGPGSRAGQRRA